MVKSNRAYKSWLGQTTGGTGAALRSRSRPAGTRVLIIVLLLLIPPHGILSENEENYFALAERFVDGSAWPQETAIFDASRHRMLSDATLGALVSAIGYAPAQVVTRLLTVAAYALVLPPLFARLRADRAGRGTGGHVHGADRRRTSSAASGCSAATRPRWPPTCWCWRRCVLC